MQKSKLTAEQAQFIDGLAALLIPWGMPNTMARVYSYLLIQNEPASLDDMVRDLEISKSNASTAANGLEQQQNARRVRERGSKRVLYVFAEDPGAAMHNQLNLLAMMAELIAANSRQVAAGAASKRMAQLAKFHRDLREAMSSVVLPKK